MGSGANTAPSRKRKKPTAAQIAARSQNGHSNKENIPPPSPPLEIIITPMPQARNWQLKYQRSQCKLRESKKRVKRLEADLATFKVTAAGTKCTAQLASERVTELTEILAKFVLEVQKKSTASAETIGRLRKQAKALKQRLRHSVRSLARTVARAKEKWSVCCVTEKGVYTAQACKIARIMADGGCAPAKVGPLMVRIGKIFGIRVTRAMDRRTVRRSIEEGGVAARMQAICEFSQSQENMDLFNRSLLARRLKRQYSVRDWLRILRGMHGDHASPEKSTAAGLKEQKHDAAIQDLGEDALSGKSYMELIEYLGAWNVRKIVEAGGTQAWNALSPAEQTARDVKMMNDILTILGREAYNALNPADRRMLDLFVWGGCCMHKDLNSFRGGNTEMMLEWKKIPGTVGPILLANKDNAALLQNLLDPAQPQNVELTEDQFRALEASTRGGVKTAALAGAIFNNKDDKKGQADRHVDFMTHSLGLGAPHRRFPDTSNTRFGSHRDAAAELITYLPQYRQMMEAIEWSKQNPSLTNIEKNLCDALNDIPTLTELAAMTIYRMVITHPYLYQVRGPGTESTNHLELGPLHHSIRNHIQKILDHPNLLFGSDVRYQTATLDGLEWADPKAMKAVFDLIPSLPHIKAITLAFFRGAQITWIRFSAEFAPGGLIDTCTATEKQLAWMPSTNNANEGALGAYHVAIRGKPSLTLHQYNAQAMFR
ncbi:hypothetical protein B0H16DRAFT_1727923 [Mycena metata]|uniref:Uncharacterized protein n=1 Tax=Mycena metata TaxID=1033252 RepID=A0AAD7IIQ4_9AGAR|nr:hypothetical protein B0H16DRAFT_1727923 [Mycena metata]